MTHHYPTEDDVDRLRDVIARITSENERLRSEVAAKDAEIARLQDALRDMLSGWRYIREQHGDLYGVGWDRAEQKAIRALKEQGDAP
jgi:hypothetical protein